MYGTLISLVALVVSIALLFIQAKYFGKCWLYPKTMQKEQKRYNVVKGIIKACIWLSVIALVISLIVWYYQWGMERADNVIFVL
jgi:phosphate starvation-inducible membrane PsiE